MLISPTDVAIEHLYPPFTDDKNQALQGWFEYVHAVLFDAVPGTAVRLHLPWRRDHRR